MLNGGAVSAQELKNVSLRFHIPTSGQKKPPTVFSIGGALQVSA